MIGPKTEDGLSWLYDAYPEVPIRYAEKTISQYYMDILDALFGGKIQKVEQIASVPIDPSPVVSDCLKDIGDDFILINIAGAKPDRLMTPEAVSKLIFTLSQQNKVVIFDEPSQKGMREIENHLPKNVIILPKLTLPELGAIAKKARCLIGTNGGATHYCATQCKALIIFSAQSFEYNFYPFVSNNGKYIKQLTQDAGIWSNKKDTVVVVQKPKQKLPFKPYYIGKEPIKVSVMTVIKALDAF